MTIAQPRIAGGVAKGGEYTNRERRDTEVSLGVCQVDGCSNPSRTPGSALCNKHYARLRNHGSTDFPAGSRVLDWSKPQYCRECGVEMIQNTAAPDGRVTHHGDGVCRKCVWARVAKDEGRRPLVEFDENGQRCTKCLRYQPFSEFTKQSEQRSGYKSHCRTCSYLYKQGISRDRYDELFESQSGRCKICARHADQVGKLVVDHDHGCCPYGQAQNCGSCVRGLLCGGCNSGIGFFRDDPQALQQAIDYLSHNLYKERNEP